MKGRTRHQGITLFELLTMLFIVGILATVAIPSFISLINRYRLTSTAESMYFALQEARSEAIKRNANVYFSFTTGDDWCYGINASANCTCSTAGSCALNTTSRLKTGQMDLSATGYGSNYVYFEGTHGAANASGSITFTLHGGTTYLTINIGRLGNLTMCGSSDLSGYTTC